MVRKSFDTGIYGLYVVMRVLFLFLDFTQQPVICSSLTGTRHFFVFAKNNANEANLRFQLVKSFVILEYTLQKENFLHIIILYG